MYYIGIDVGGTNLVAGLVNEKGHILDKVNHPVDKTMTAVEFCEELARMSRKLCEMGAMDYSQIEAVGVACPAWWTTGPAGGPDPQHGLSNPPSGPVPEGVERPRLPGQRRQLRRRGRVLGRRGQGL